MSEFKGKHLTYNSFILFVFVGTYNILSGFFILPYLPFRACHFCKSCHGDIVDVRAIKKCRCKTCGYCSCGSTLIVTALNL